MIFLREYMLALSGTQVVMPGVQSGKGVQTAPYKVKRGPLHHIQVGKEFYLPIFTQIFLDQEKAAALEDGSLTDLLAKAIAGAGAAILSDYGKGALTDVSRMVDICRDAGVPALVDPKGQDFSKYRGASLITPNQGEFEAVRERLKNLGYTD